MTHNRRATSNARIALILTSAPEAGRLDRSMLRRQGFDEALILGSGAEAALKLLKTPAALVLCHERFDDMCARDFARLVRLHPRLRSLPLVLSAAPDQRGRSIADTCLVNTSTAPAGSADHFQAVLPRPYSYNDLSNVLRQALAVSAIRAKGPGETDASEAAFHAELTRLRNPEPARPDTETLCRRGRRQRALHRWASARALYNQALELDPECAEAHEGLAAAWKAEGRPDKYREHLLKAARLYVEIDPVRARKVFEVLRRIDPNAPDPLHSLAEGRLKAMDYAGAARAVALALDAGESPDPAVYGRIARACLFTEEPADTARQLCRELAKLGLVDEARVLFRRIAGEPKTVADGAAPAGARAEREPKPATNWLGEALAVARFTFKAYRQGRAQA